MGVRSEPRFTRDVDVAVAVDSDAAAGELIFGLTESGYDIIETTEHETSGRLATVRLLPSHHRAATAVVDLLFASSGIENEVVEGASDVEVLPGFRAVISSTGHLIALKLLSESDDRPHDLGDLRALLAAASETDIELARRAVGLIEERGYNRGRDLANALVQAASRWR